MCAYMQLLCLSTQNGIQLKATCFFNTIYHDLHHHFSGSGVSYCTDAPSYLRSPTVNPLHNYLELCLKAHLVDITEI